MKTILTAQDVARLLAVDPITVYRLARKGRLPAFKVGNLWRFDRSMLEEWMARQAQRAVTSSHVAPPGDQ